MAGAGRLLAQDESDGSGARYRLVYEKIDKCDVADARFLPWCACPLSPACRSLATTAKSGAAAMVGGFDRWLYVSCLHVSGDNGEVSKIQKKIKHAHFTCIDSRSRKAQAS